MKEEEEVPSPKELRHIIVDMTIYFESKGYTKVEAMTAGMCFLPTMWVQMGLDIEDVQEACRVMIRAYERIKGVMDGTMA